jgi:hypothetical protein
MKQFLVILLTLTFISAGLGKDSTWQFGYQLGANLSSFTGDDPYGNQSNKMLLQTPCMQLKQPNIRLREYRMVVNQFSQISISSNIKVSQ